MSGQALPPWPLGALSHCDGEAEPWRVVAGEEGSGPTWCPGSSPNPACCPPSPPQ